MPEFNITQKKSSFSCSKENWYKISLKFQLALMFFVPDWEFSNKKFEENCWSRNEPTSLFYLVFLGVQFKLFSWLMNAKHNEVIRIPRRKDNESNLFSISNKKYWTTLAPVVVWLELQRSNWGSKIYCMRAIKVNEGSPASPFSGC